MATVQRPKTARWFKSNKKDDQTNEMIGYPEATQNKQIPSRDRKDSGYSEYCCSPDDHNGLQSVAEWAFTSWTQTTALWESRVQNIIQGQFGRMQKLNGVRKKQLLEGKDMHDIEDSFFNDLESMLATSQSLIECVSNDILEGSEVAPNRIETRGDHLDEIPEEADNKSKEFNVLMTDFPDDSFVIGGKVWKKKKSYSVKNGQKHPRVYMENEMTGSRRWNKDLDSQKMWVVEEDGNSNAILPELEPEDIMSDWIKMLRRTEGPDENDLNESFWDISLGTGRRKRKISEVLDQLPFQDKPDIFEDYWELLDLNDDKEKKETEVKLKHIREPKKQYWNIFNEWKHNLEENGRKRRQMRRRRTKSSQRNPKRMTKSIVQRSEAEDLDISDIFNDARHLFEEKPRQQRKRRRSNCLHHANAFLDLSHWNKESPNWSDPRKKVSRRRSYEEAFQTNKFKDSHSIDDDGLTAKIAGETFKDWSWSSDEVSMTSMLEPEDIFQDWICIFKEKDDQPRFWRGKSRKLKNACKTFIKKLKEKISK